MGWEGIFKRGGRRGHGFYPRNWFVTATLFNASPDRMELSET
jgi:hypothetical protein